MHGQDWRRVKARELAFYSIVDSEVFLEIDELRNSYLSQILQKAQNGDNWRETEKGICNTYNIDIMEAADFIKTHWSKTIHIREQKKLLRILAVKEALKLDWQALYSERASYFGITIDLVKRRADLLMNTSYGRESIITGIVQCGAGNDHWREENKDKIDLLGFTLLDFETRVSRLKETQRAQSESSARIRADIKKERTIMTLLDVIEHPDYSADDFSEARERALLPRYRTAVLKALIQKVIEGTKIHLNYFEYMRVQQISWEEVFTSARNLTMNSIICKVNLGDPAFDELLVPWRSSLQKIDSKLLRAYDISNDDLHKLLRQTSRAILLKDICLLKPESDEWIAWYQVPLTLAELSQHEVQEHINLTRELDEDDINKMFGEFPDDITRMHSLAWIEAYHRDMNKLQNRFIELWRATYYHLGDVIFDLCLDSTRLSIGIIRGADLLDEKPSFESEKILLDALSDIATLLNVERTDRRCEGTSGTTVNINVDD